MGGGVWGGGVGLRGGQGGCDRRIELKFLGKFKKKKIGGWRGRGGGGGSGWMGGGGGGGVRVDVNEKLKFL